MKNWLNRALLAPVLALVAQHVAVVGWGLLTVAELSRAAEVLATTLTMVALLLVLRWNRKRLPGQEPGSTARNLLAFAAALVIVLGNVMLAVASSELLLWYRDI